MEITTSNLKKLQATTGINFRFMPRKMFGKHGAVGIHLLAPDMVTLQRAIDRAMANLHDTIWIYS